MFLLMKGVCMTVSIMKDLIYFLKMAEENHIDFYFLHTKKELEEYIINFFNNNEVKDKYDFTYMINNIIKYMLNIYDSHTKAYINSIWLPLDIKYIDGNLYITKCFDENYINSKIISINSIPVIKLMREYEKALCYGTPEFLEREIELGFKNASKLLILPSITETNVFDFETDKGMLSVDVTKKYDFKKSQDDKYKIINNTLIVKYESCVEENVPNISYIDSLIKEKNITSFALDLRNNNGGNEKLLYPLIDYLKNSNLKLYTIVNKGVISSSRWNLIDMKRIGSKIIGEQIGTPLNCFGSNKMVDPTPNMGINLVFSKWYMYYDENDVQIKSIRSKEELDSMPKSIFEPKYLEIDEYIDYDVSQLKNGIDPVYLYFENLTKNNAK